MREEHLLPQIPAHLLPVYAAMRASALALGDNVAICATTKNITFRAPWVFAEIHPKKSSLRMLIRPDDLSIPEGESQTISDVLVKRVPNSHNWHVPYWIEVDEHTPIDGLAKLLRRSYDAVQRATQ